MALSTHTALACSVRCGRFLHRVHLSLAASYRIMCALLYAPPAAYTHPLHTAAAVQQSASGSELTCAYVQSYCLPSVTRYTLSSGMPSDVPPITYMASCSVTPLAAHSDTGRSARIDHVLLTISNTCTLFMSRWPCVHPPASTR